MVQLLTINNLVDGKYELSKINVSSQGVEYMAKKLMLLPIKITNVKLGAANILKQEMLSIGGDCAVARGIVEGSLPISEVILLGAIDKYEKLITKLNFQPIFGLKQIQSELREIVDNFINPQTNLKLNHVFLDLSKLNIMGILNITPDSFSDGNDHLDFDKAISHAKKMINDGADIIDIGGESSRPGSIAVSVDEEMKRVIPVIKAIREFSDIPISIDTTKSEVAKSAILAGANILNDISALNFDNEMITVLQEFPEIPIIMMHMKGTPKTMQDNPIYEDTINDILLFFKERLDFCDNNNISKNRIIIDPGIGFGKRKEDNLIILKKINEFKTFGVPILLGASRKRFIDSIYPSSPKERLEGTLATTSIAYNNGVNIIRVHDVKENKNFISVLEEISKSK